MNAPANLIIPAIGTPMHGGFFAGAILLSDGPWGLIKAPKALGDIAGVYGPYKDVRGAASLIDGPANTRAMADAGSTIASRIIDLKIGEHGDWYLPAQDEIEVMYRHCKPTADVNSLYMRSGINLHTMPPTPPYTETDPAQTAVEIFRAGGAEAFEPDAYWTSTQYAGDSYYAWAQWFDDGYQRYWLKDNEVRACPVRRFKI